MKKRFKNFSLISIGVIFGILVSINLSVFADKKEEAKKLPVEDLRIFAEVFGKIKADYVEDRTPAPPSGSLVLRGASVRM